MEMVYLLLPLALLLVLVAVIAFIWAVRSGQMDDLDTPAYRALHEESHSEDRREDKARPKTPADSESISIDDRPRG